MMRRFARTTILLLAATLLGAVLTVQARAAEPFHGMGLVFAAEDTLFMEAEDGTVYLLEGIDMAPYAGMAVTVDGIADESGADGPVLHVLAVVEDDLGGLSPQPGALSHGHL